MLSIYRLTVSSFNETARSSSTRSSSTEPSLASTMSRSRISSTRSSTQDEEDEPPHLPLRNQATNTTPSINNNDREEQLPSRRLSRRFSSGELLRHAETISSNQQYRQQINEELLPALTHELHMSPALGCCRLPEEESSLQLTEMGTCVIFHHGGTFCTVLEVPPRGECFFMYSVVWREFKPSVALMQRALELNYLGQQTHGATLSLDPSCEMAHDGMEYTLSYAHPIPGLNADTFCLLVMNFMVATRDVHKKLASICHES